jgi:uncharacterized protein (DUF427 family)
MYQTPLKMAAKIKMNVQSFPRPPRLEKISRQLQITWEGQVVADTNAAYWVLETHHPPSESINVGNQQPLTDISELTICLARQ